MPASVVLPPAARDELLDTSLDQLVFDVETRRKHGLSTGVGDFLQDGKVTQTMKGATGIELDFLDRDYAALQSGLFGTRIEVAIDNVPFRLTQVSLVDDEQLRAVFEHRLIAEMRQHTHPLKAKRGTVTRAEFILKMLRELKAPYSFICPELRRHQPIAPPSQSEREAESQPNALGGVPGTELTPIIQVARQPGLTGEQGPGNRARGDMTQTQLDTCSTLVSVGKGLNAPTLALEAVICATFGESTAGEDPGTYTPNEAGYWGVLQWGSGQRGSVPSGIDPHDAATGAYYFFKGGKGFQSGGAIALARANPSMDPGEIATKVEASGQPGSFYGQFRSKAQNFLSKYHGEGATIAGTGASAPSPTVRTAEYEFSRGKHGQKEDTFICALRLAEEVLWRFFVVGRKSGRQSIYFVQDDDLYKARPRYTIGPETVGLRKLTFDVEVGKRTVVIRGRRQPKPSEAVLIVRADRWDAPPGTVIEVNDYGPADGKWLVDSIERGIYDAEMTVHLRAPEKPIAEKRQSEGQAGEEQREGQRSGSAVNALREAVTQLGVPYHWGGEKAGVAFDCSGLVQWAFAKVGTNLPRNAQEQYTASKRVSASEAGEGDLVFFGSGPSGVSHVGIIVTKGKMIDAPNPTSVVRFDDFPQQIGASWGSERVVGFGRV